MIRLLPIRILSRREVIPNSTGSRDCDSPRPGQTLRVLNNTTIGSPAGVGG